MAEGVSGGNIHILCDKIALVLWAVQEVKYRLSRRLMVALEGADHLHATFVPSNKHSNVLATHMLTFSGACLPMSMLDVAELYAGKTLGAQLIMQM